MMLYTRTLQIGTWALYAQLSNKRIYEEAFLGLSFCERHLEEALHLLWYPKLTEIIEGNIIVLENKTVAKEKCRYSWPVIEKI